MWIFFIVSDSLWEKKLLWSLTSPEESGNLDTGRVLHSSIELSWASVFFEEVG